LPKASELENSRKIDAPPKGGASQEISKNQSLILFHRGEIKAKQDGALKIRNITKL